MPIYEYRCEACGKTFEVLEYSVEDRPQECPDCGGRRLARLISSPAVLRKGGLPKGGTTCCGQTERCDVPPCAGDRSCTRDK
jgi:putative FmdB family regulatory protein